MLTTFAFGRNPLPAPIISVSTGGNIPGGGNTYYFWIKGRNRAGFSTESLSTTIVIPNSGQLTFSSLNFQQFDYEDWRSFHLLISSTNDVATSKIFYKRENYNSDEQLLPISNVIFNNTDILSPNTIASFSNFPNDIPNGYRVFITSVSSVYEMNTTSTLIPNGVTVITGVVGNWELVESNNLYEPTSDLDLVLEVIDSENVIKSDLNTVAETKEVKYYIINNDQVSIAGEINLNQQFSNPSVNVTFDVKVIGYLDLTTFVLDTSNIDNVGIFQEYPSNNITLNKSIPSNSACVLTIVPKLNFISNTLIANTSISLYPKIVNYTLITTPELIGEPVATLSALGQLASQVVRNGQIRHVESKNRYYYYKSTDTTAPDGNFVIAATFGGRWLSVQVELLDGSVTLAKLDPSITSLFNLTTSTVDIAVANPTTYNLNFNDVDEEYIRLTTSLDDGFLTPFVFNFTHSSFPGTNISIEKIVELVYRTSPVSFDNSISFPGNTIPTPSGNGSRDLFLLQITQDNVGNSYKRMIVIAQDV